MSYGVIVILAKSSDFIPSAMESSQSILGRYRTRSYLCGCCCLRKDHSKYCVEIGVCFGTKEQLEAYCNSSAR